MGKLKVVHTLYTGLGGHANVVFPLLEAGFDQFCSSSLVFYGVENLSPIYRLICDKNNYSYTTIQKNSREYIRPLKKFKKILAAEQPDVIIIHNSELILGAISHRNKYNNCKVFFVEHQDNKTKSRILKFLSNYALKKANAVICLSENYQTELRELYACKAPIVVIGNGIDIRKYQPNLDSQTTNKKVYGMASRMMPTKDHLTLLKAFVKLLKKHPSCILKLAGVGETLNQVKTWTKNLKIAENIEFLGLLDEEEMLNFYTEIDIYILATTAETQSTGILQAMACGLPIITSDIPNNKQLITHKENGLLYRNLDSEDLIKQLLFAQDNAEIIQNLGQKAREKAVANYSVSKMVDNYIALVQS